MPTFTAKNWKIILLTNWNLQKWKKLTKPTTPIQDPVQRFDKLNPTWSRMHSINREAFCNCKHPEFERRREKLHVSSLKVFVRAST